MAGGKNRLVGKEVSDNVEEYGLMSGVNGDIWGINVQA